MISDYSPINLNLKFCSLRQAYSWSFNPYVFEDQAFTTHIFMHISQFLEIDNVEVNDTILWETLKGL